MIVVLEKNIFKTDSGKTFVLNDILDEEFYKFSDTIVDEYHVDLCICNDIFFTFVQKIIGLKRYFEMNSVERINIDVLSCDFDLACMTIAAADSLKILVSLNKAGFVLAKIKDLTKSVVFFCGSIGYILLKAVFQKYTGSPDTSYDKFSIIRINQEYNKFGFLREDKEILFDYERIQNTLSKNEKVSVLGNVYDKFRFGQKLSWLLRSIKKAFVMMSDEKKFLKSKLGTYAAMASRSYYAKRVVHINFYTEMLDSYFSLFKNKTYITGKIWDRYAMAEKRTAEKYGIKVVVYPHGVGYGFRLPDGFNGDVFYAFSAHSADHFNRIYKTEKFLFDGNVVGLLLGRKYQKNDGSPKVVFFSEAHEPEVNIEIVQKLLETFDKNDIKLVLKPHPIEQLEFYSDFKDRIIFENDFDKAITGNFCIARRSTTLLEAIYNGSVPYALLTNVSDYAIYKMYPALHDERIFPYFETERLAEAIVEKVRRR